MKQVKICSVVLLGLLLGACNTSSSQPPVTQPPVTQPPVTPPTTPPAPVAGSSWQAAISLTYGAASSRSVYSGSATWYKVEAKAKDKLEIAVRTSSKYPTSKFDSVLNVYAGTIYSDLTDPQASNDDGTPDDDGDFGSKLSYTAPIDGVYLLKVTGQAIYDGKLSNDSLNIYDVLVTLVGKEK